jgi:hypothetical protein
MMAAVVALMYHDVVPREEVDRSGFRGSTAARYKLGPSRFEDHLDALAATGRRVVSYSAAMRPTSR